MHHSPLGMLLVVMLATAAGYATRQFILRAKVRTVAIAQADLFGYMLTYAGLLSIVPEAITIFAPEIASRDSISGTVWSKLDYLTYVAVAAASGVNIMKRVMFLKHMKETTKTS